ncbi:sulfotransferase family protein [Nocardioides antri]|uniref:sulfotransferase family protein n=1 Tax=Nocardioides antri TaxID=2607659 RepID=UPI00165F660B|nr:sulfotransferase family protein [Nocardioides antri]
MAPRVVGAGVGRTGTLSLKTGLERLLGGPCYHGSDVFTRPRHIRIWRAAARGDAVDWAAFLDGYAAVVDWPAAAFWEEICAAFPDAVVLLSTRESVDAWHRSADETIFRYAPLARVSPVVRMFSEVLAARFTPDARDPEEAKAAYERHNAHVRATVPPDRLVEWSPGDGWEPLCAALGLPVPDEPFPRVNTKADWDRLPRVWALGARMLERVRR